MKYNLTYKPLSPFAILIQWPSKIDKKIIKDILAFESKIENLTEIVDTIIAYNSVTILYKDSIKNFTNKVTELENIYAKTSEFELKSNRIWQIPVCYHPSFGLDLEELACDKKLTINEVIKKHTEPNYFVFFMGFQPGFPYLGGLDKILFTPRKATPRIRVDKGSVGIGGEQTGVYSQESSGGWNIIGRTPVDFFNQKKQSPSFLKPGDSIKFHSIDLYTMKELEGEISRGVYHLKFKKDD